MKSFDPKRSVGATVPLGISWRLGMVMEAKGRQDLYEKQSPEVLRTLRELAIVESPESSNRIEGVAVEPGRRRPAGRCSEALGTQLIFPVKLVLAVAATRRELGSVVRPCEVSAYDRRC